MNFRKFKGVTLALSSSRGRHDNFHLIKSNSHPFALALVSFTPCSATPAQARYPILSRLRFWGSVRDHTTQQGDQLGDLADTDGFLFIGD